MAATAHAGRMYKQCSLTDSSGSMSFESDGVYTHNTPLFSSAKKITSGCCSFCMFVGKRGGIGSVVLLSLHGSGSSSSSSSSKQTERGPSFHFAVASPRKNVNPWRAGVVGEAGGDHFQQAASLRSTSSLDSLFVRPYLRHWAERGSYPLNTVRCRRKD